MSLLVADIVVKRFCASWRAILLQCQARIRNADSKIHSPRFDCCAFLFYSSVAVTFATISAISRSHVNSRLMSQNLHCTKPLRGGSAVEVGNCNPNSTSPCVLPLSASVSCLAQDVENVHRDDRADDGMFWRLHHTGVKPRQHRRRRRSHPLNATGFLAAMPM
jgi:hypothetical protein